MRENTTIGENALTFIFGEDREERHLTPQFPGVDISIWWSEK
jgi:hypothetical protein